MDDYRLHQNLSVSELFQLINMTSEEDSLSTATETALVAAYVLVILAGLILNSVACYVVLKKRSLRTSRNMFILNLAISDMVMCLFCMPFTLVKLLVKNWVFGDILCRTIPWLQATNVFASTITITAIAMDRYHVLLYLCMAKERLRAISASCLILAIWAASSIVGLPLLIHGRTLTQTHAVTFTVCIEQWPSQGSKYAYATVVLLLQFLLPIGLLVSLHWRISRFLHHRINRSPQNREELRRTLDDARRHRKNTLLLMAIAITYALCWFPLTLLNFLADFYYQMFMQPHFLLAFGVAHLVAMLSAIANPIMYGWFNSNFKSEFRRLVLFWRPTKYSANAEGRKGKPAGLNRAESTYILHKKPICYKAIQTDVQPRNKAIQTDVQPPNKAIQTDVQPPYKAIQTDVQPPNKAIQTDVQPPNKAIQTDVQPPYKAIQTNVQPPYKAIQTNVQPSYKAIQTDVQPPYKARQTDMQLSYKAIQTDVQRPNKITETDVQPSYKPIQTDVQPPHKITQTDVQPRNKAIQTDIQPPCKAIQTDKQPPVRNKHVAIPNDRCGCSH